MPSRPRSTSIYVNNPTDILPLTVPKWDVAVSSAALKNNSRIFDTIREIVTTFCPDVTITDVDDLEITQLGGGLTNVLYLVKGHEGKGVVNCLVRVNGSEESDILVDRQIENRVSSCLSKMSLAPIYFGRFQNGRVEEFYTGSSPLSPSKMHPGDSQLSSPAECNSYCWRILESMSKMHLLEIPEGVAKTDGEATIWDQTDEWMRLAEEIYGKNGGKVEEGMGEGVYDKLKERWGIIKEHLMAEPKTPAEAFARATVFCHMDCQSLNILTLPSPDSSSGEAYDPHAIKLIDFEYSCFNPRSVDLGNTFCEMCECNDLKPDWDKEYPQGEEATWIVERYVDFQKPGMREELGEGWDEFIEGVRIEIDKHSLLSHYGWCFWSIIQDDVSHIDYDYMLYAKIRWGGSCWMWDRVMKDVA